MPKKQSNNDKRKRFNRKLYIVIGILVCVSLVFFELVTGNIPYYIKWQQCNQQPVVVTEPVSIGFGAQPQKYFLYSHPGFFDSKLPIILRIGNPMVYCSAHEAMQKYGTDLQVQN